MIRRAAMGLCVAVIACAGIPTHDPVYTKNPAPAGIVPEKVPVWIDKRFSAVHRTAIHEAFRQWDIALNGYESFDIVSDAFDMEPSVIESIDFTGQGLLVLRRSKADPLLEDLPDGVLGWVSTDLQTEAHVLNLVEDAIGNRDLTSITEHEIGHTLRLPHLPAKGTLMFPSYRFGSPCVDQFTVRVLATVRGWRYQSMNWCLEGNS